ncbi:dihydropteroate synthase [Amycolatopsis ultiminotia]|uniref:Dihydropteroate synthase n=1 Tax=Amycolatopsis ultiminotia TaxID=543629 RepID=A0ABP6X8S3_9PSEU
MSVRDRLAEALAGPRPLICGILNVTPDSFSDGGRYRIADAAVERGRQLVEDGADLIDIGGESTRPGSHPPTVEEELARVVPVLERLSAATEVPLSVDTSRPEVMRAAVDAGAAMINDVRALRYPSALSTAAETGAVVCLSHMLAPPHLMQLSPGYHDVVGEVSAFLADRIEACARTGIPAQRLVIDPGFGFGKTLEHNLTLLSSVDAFRELGPPVMAGLSRKAMLGRLTGRPVHERMVASVAAGMLAVQRGVRVLRVHDVAETRDALTVLAAAGERTCAGGGDQMIARTAFSNPVT